MEAKREGRPVSSPSKNRLILALAYPVVWTLSVGAFWTFMSGADAMGYAIAFIWVLNPVCILAVSFVVGRGGTPLKLAWLTPVLLGIAYMLLPYATFSLANTLVTGNIHVPDVAMALFGAIISAVGLGLGILFRLRVNPAKDGTRQQGRSRSN